MSQDDAMSVLRLYGLEQAITDQDDPHLWATAVTKHWPAPDDPRLRDWPIDDAPRLSFGVGRLPGEDNEASDWSGMTIDERWAFVRVDARHFRAHRGETAYPHFILDISRPSAATGLAWVHAGDNPAPLVGYGETKVWVRREDGAWIETSEVVSRWIS